MTASFRRPRRFGRRSAPPVTIPRMDLTLSPAELELQARARAFVTDVLQPLEVEFERSGRPAAGGAGPRAPAARRSPPTSTPARSRRRSAARAGRRMEQVLVHEQFGQVTGGLWSYVPGGYNVLVHCDPEQRRRYLEPSIRGERSGSYAITEAGAGSDARTPGLDRGPRPGHRRTTSSTARSGSSPAPTTPTSWSSTAISSTASGACRPSSSSTTTRPGVRLKHDPDYTHTFADRHPQFVLEDVRVPAVGDPRADRRRRRADQRVVRRGADPHRRALQRGDGAAADDGGRLGDRAGPVR